MTPFSFYTDNHSEQDSRFMIDEDIQRKLIDIDLDIPPAPKERTRETATSFETFVAEIYTAVAAIAILCNLLLLFLISRKKQYQDEESKQPTYNRIMCALAIISSFTAGNYFVAGISGSLADNLNLPSIDTSESLFELTSIMKQLSDISLGCYIQSVIDWFCYIAFTCGCCWLCLYFLLKLNYGVAKISPFVEVAVYAIIFLFSLGNLTFQLIRTNVTVNPNPVAGICVIFPLSDDITVTIFVMIFTGIFVFGTLAMLLIIYKTFREEQQINELSLSSFKQLSNEQQQLHPAISLSNFEASKDIAKQAFVFLVFLMFSYYIQMFLIFQSGFMYQIMDIILDESQGVYLLALYLWFEMRNIKKQYPNVTSIHALKAIFNEDTDMEPVVEGDIESREQTPLLAEKQRCLIDITLVEDDMCKDVMDAFRSIDADDEDEELLRAKRIEEEKRLKLQAENMRMFAVGHDSTLHQALEASFEDLDLEIANRKMKHYSASKDTSRPVTHRYGSIDPTTFRTETTEKEIDNLSAEGNRDQSALKIVGEGIVMEEIQEGDEEEEEKSSKDDTNQQVYLGPATLQQHQQQYQQGGRSVISDLTMISTLRF